MNEKQLEEALRTWPLAEVPTGLSEGVLGRINSRPGIPVQYQLRFRLTWLDYALGLFLSLLPVLGFITIPFLPRKLVLYWQYQWLVLQFPAFEPLLFAFGGTIVMIMLLVLLFSLRYLLPRRISPF